MIIIFTAGLGGCFWLIFVESIARKILMGLVSLWLIINGTGLLSGSMPTVLLSLISITLLIVFMDHSIGSSESLSMAGPYSTEAYLGMLAVNLVFDLEEILEVSSHE